MEKLFASVNRDHVVTALLFGTVAALGYRSVEQQQEIETLKAEKSSLKAANAAMYSTMWAWRQKLYAIAEPQNHKKTSTTASSSTMIPLSRLRTIFGEPEDVPSSSFHDPSDIQSGVGEEEGHERFTIS